MNLKKLMSFVAVLSISCLPIFAQAQTPAQSEEKILGTMVALNKNEIAAGELANKKSSNKQVKKFASFMIKEHSKNLKEAEHLGNPMMNAKEAMKLQAQGKKELSSLSSLSGNAFDKAYIDAMVKGHEAALNLVHSLMNEATNPKVKKYLAKTEKHVQHHLAKAKAIQASV